MGSFKIFLDLVVQVVDARRPLLYRCADVEKYVKEVALRQGEEKGLVLKLPKKVLRFRKILKFILNSNYRQKRKFAFGQQS